MLTVHSHISKGPTSKHMCVCVCVSTDGHLFGPEEEEEKPENVLQIINKQATTS